jgi:DNA-directed RNA polymerase specialized sigma24 family protein
MTFHEFAATRLPALLRFAVVLTGDRGLAEDVVQEALRTELDKLPRRQRAVLVLRYYAGLSDAQIAEVLGCSAGTVRGYASRALAALRIELRPAPQPVRELT